MRPPQFPLFILLLVSCNSATESEKPQPTGMQGTWKMITGIDIRNGDTVMTDYTGDTSFIKILNETHFAFFLHDVNKGKDLLAAFVAGGGPYTFSDSTYKEDLEYCSARDWEGHQFTFNITMRSDTMIQSGEEKAAGVTRYIVEKYVRWK